MLIECPDCRHAIRIVDRRPGRFNPRCPKCSAVFELVVPLGKDEELTVSSLATPRPLSQGEPDRSVLEPQVEEEPIGGATRRADFRPAWLPRGTPRILGGYLLLRLLGHGPRGRAFLARPISFLDEPAVLKVLAADRARDPVFLARYVREAFAAAWLRHPNLIAIREIDTHRGHHYVAVEWVAGPSLAEVLHEKGTVEPGRAAVMILQAARGLRSAHLQGLWHRDVKPANLRIDPLGLIRVDDLGLEMTPSLASAIEARETRGSGGRPFADGAGPASAVRAAGEPPLPQAALAGTPAFMAPEQSEDPLAADGRSDIYALGATFYNLVTGRPPFLGETAVELIRSHTEVPLIPPGEFVPSLPRRIADIIQTMMAKRPEERYPSMDIVIDVLEDLLGLGAEAAARELMGACRQADQVTLELAMSPATKLRDRTLLAAGGVWAVFLLFMMIIGLRDVAFVLFALGAMTAVLVTALSKPFEGSRLLRLARTALLGCGLGVWLLPALFGAAWTALLIGLGGCLSWFLLICAGGLAGGYHVFLERPRAAERERTRRELEAIVRRLRARGHDEKAIRRALSGEAGRVPPSLVEPLFVYNDIRVEAREGRDDPHSSARIRQSSWRGVVIEWLERRAWARRDRRQLRILREAEEGIFEAQGVNLLTARRKAARVAKAMVLTASEWRDETRLLSRLETSETHGPPLLERLQRAAAAPEPVLEPHETHPSAVRRRIDSFGDMLLGRGLRFLLGMALLVVLALWLDAQGIVTWPQVRQQVSNITETLVESARAADPERLKTLKWEISLDLDRLRDPVTLTWLPEGPWDDIPASNVAFAALILLASTISPRRVAGLTAIAATFVALFGTRCGLHLPAISRHFGFDAHAQARSLAILIFLLYFLIPNRRPRI